MGKESLQFTKRRKNRATGSSISSTQRANIRKMQGRKTFVEEDFNVNVDDADAVIEEVVRLGDVAKATPALAAILNDLGVPAVIKGYIVEKMKRPVGSDAPIKVSAQQRYQEAAESKLKSERKRQRLAELLHKREAGFFDTKPVNDVYKRILEREREELRYLLVDQEVDIDERNDVGRIRVLERGFTSYYYRKPPFSAKFDTTPQPSFLKFNQDVTSIAEMMGGKSHNLAVQVPDGLREVTRRDVLDSVTSLFDLKEREQSEQMKRLDELLSDDDEEDAEDESVRPFQLIPKHAFLEGQFKEYCANMNTQRAEKSENAEALAKWAASHSLPADEEEPAENEELGDNEDGETQRLFDSFLKDHNVFYSVYSLDGIDGIGIYEQLRDKNDKNALDTYVFEQLKKNPTKYDINESMIIDADTDESFEYFIKNMQQNTHETIKLIIGKWASSKSQPKVNKKSNLLDDLLGEPARRAKKRVKVSPIDLQSNLLFDRFLQTHDRFYSVYSFVGGDHQFTGIYEQLRNQTDKNVLDAYIYEQIQKKATRYEEILKIPRQTDTYFDASFIHDMEKKTHEHLRLIIRGWLQRKPLNMGNNVREYLTRVRKIDCSSYRREWNRRYKPELEDEYARMRKEHTEEMKSFKKTQKMYEKPDAGQAMVDKDMRDRLVLRVYNLENDVYDQFGESTIIYLSVIAPILIGLDAEHAIGKHSRMFRAKVLSGAYTIDRLYQLSLAHIFTELVLGDTDAFLENYIAASHDSIQEEIVRFFTKRNATIRRPKNVDGPSVTLALPEPVRPQGVCLNDNDIDDGDLILCKGDDGFYCYSIKELTKLFNESENPIDPLTSAPFSQRLVEQIKSRIQ